MPTRKSDDHTEANLTARNSILEAIKKNLKAEQLTDIGEIGNVAGAIDKLAAKDLYSKGPVGNNYGKNTERQSFDQSDLIRTINEVQKAIKS